MNFQQKKTFGASVCDFWGILGKNTFLGLKGTPFWAILENNALLGLGAHYWAILGAAKYLIFGARGCPCE